MKKLILTTFIAAAAANVFAVQGTITTADGSQAGDIKWQPRAKQYIVSAKMGKTMVDKEIKLADVTALDIKKPEGFDKAVQMVESGNGTAAIPVLQKIASEYRMLQWDKQAGRYLVLAYIASGNAQKAYDACQPIVNEDKTAAYSGDLASAYWQSLLKLGKNDQLEALLKKAAKSGNRQASAAAFVMRGDIIVSQSNDARDELARALRDGYLRVCLMYRDAECVNERREALQKAATCFDKMGQPSRAEKLRAEAKAM